MTKLINTHPGELLMEDFLKPMKISAYRLANETKLPNQRLHAIIHGTRSITVETDLRLCAFFGLTPGYWMRAQLSHDLRAPQHSLGKTIASEVRPMKKETLQ